MIKRTIAIFSLLIVIALIAVFRGKPELQGVVDLTPSSNAGAAGIAAPAAGPGAPSSGTPGRIGAPAPVGPAPAPSSSARDELIHSADAKLVRGTGELGTINAHAQFIASSGSRALLAAASRVAGQMVDCLKSGACTETPPENQAYFDPDNTASQRLLTQSLRLLVEGSNVGVLPDGSALGEEKLLDVVKTGNEEARLLALELLMKGGFDSSVGSGPGLGSQSAAAGGQGQGQGMNPDLFDRILAERDRFQGDSGQMFYSMVRESSTGSQVLRSHFMEALSDTWSNGDPETVLELVRHADQLGFSEQEYDQSVAKLCRFTAPSYPKANWRAIRHHLENLRSKSGFQLSPRIICNEA